MIWVYSDNKGNILNVNTWKKTKTFKNATFWTNKRMAITWKKYVIKKFPNMILTKTKISLNYE